MPPRAGALTPRARFPLPPARDARLGGSTWTQQAVSLQDSVLPPWTGGQKGGLPLPFGTTGSWTQQAVSLQDSVLPPWTGGQKGGSCRPRRRSETAASRKGESECDPEFSELLFHPDEGDDGLLRMRAGRYLAEIDGQRHRRRRKSGELLDGREPALGILLDH